MTPTVTDTIETLDLYNAKAAELNTSSFLQTLKEKGSGSFDLLPGPFRAIRKGGPGSEAVKAFLFTFRTFYRDGDGISFREIDELYREMSVGDEVKQEIAAIRADLARYLDGFTPIIANGERIKRRDLLDTWLYGVEAHFNRKKRSRLKRWGVADDVHPLFAHEFETIVVTVLQAIFWVRKTNLTALGQLRGDIQQSGAA
jgi:hypothetical protein